ncbi:MAG: hypothetical protein IPP66_13635 [Anaerolineales bacterium]|nr:hypothetical protein [Anaerolineales bacterium]
MSKTAAKKAIEVQEVSLLSAHSEALIEIGKGIVKDSVTTAREFCKSMISTSTGAIPIYLGILTFILPNKFELGVPAGVTVAAPAVGFLIAAIIFTFGYLPLADKFSLDIIEEIQNALEKNLAYRKRFIWYGLGVFIVSTLLAIYVIVINIGVK